MGLKTAGAFHTPLMESAKRKLEDALKEVQPRLKPPRCNVYLNTTGMVFKAGSDPKSLIPLLCNQLISPVLWDSCVKAMIASGMNEFYEGANEAVEGNDEAHRPGHVGQHSKH